MVGLAVVLLEVLADTLVAGVFADFGLGFGLLVDVAIRFASLSAQRV